MAELPGGTVTFLFTDVEGSTRLLKQLRRDYGEVLAAHRELLRRAFAEHGGQEIDTQGDAFFVAFSRAHDAVSAAVEAQRALAAHPWPDGVELLVRMGLHTGEPAVGTEGYHGLGVHRAARICAAGHGGQVLVSSVTYELVEDDLPVGVGLQELGVHRLKDIDRPERLYQLAIEGLRSEFPPLRTPEGEHAGVVEIRLLGGLRVERDGKPLPLPQSAKARSLLAWLALHPGVHSRARVAPLLWPDVLDESARASLRTALWALRQALGEATDDVLASTRDGIGVSPEVWIDVAAPELLSDTGELLPELDDEWVFEARERRREAVGDALESLVLEAEQRGELDRAIELSKRRIALDPLAEDAHRELFRLLGQSGDRAEAAAAYRRLRQRLWDDLRIAPSAETRRAIEQVQAPAVERRFPARLERMTGGVFVGRQEDLRRLEDLWARAVTLETPLVGLLTGEPGIGKSRLAAEFATRMRGSATVLYGAATEEALIPYQPLVEALEGSFEELVGQDEGGPASHQRYRLFERVVDAIDAASPLILVLDDLHWADAPTAQLLRHLVRSSRLRSLLVVATSRAREPGAPIVDLIGDLRRDDLVEQIRLGGLAEEEVEELVAALAQGEDARAVYERTDGHPLFARELLRHIAESGEREDVPEGVRELLELRLHRLAPSTAGLLTVAAVAGVEFSPAPVGVVAGLDRDELVDALDESLRSGLVEPGMGCHRFSHALVRDALYADLTAPRRSDLHRRLAEELERRHGVVEGPQLAELAYHFCAAEDERGADLAVRAGDYAVSQHAFEQAVDLYGRALGGIPPDDPRRRAVAGKRGVAFQLLYHLVIDAPAETTTP